ncbi:hypothetical protein [Kitasatospora sp. SUK 42]|uniref:hypothetical protein n=1 Tax=Kitasatospora sp. SUK 42 TaxID=1588882 RepID=UPI0018CA64DF|nr:hypothetical protein [Kitasatospora sp. SUK 42]MBV2156432.1 hypothetical protein [Kitasatospora sp. SUK 42]
MAKQDDRVFVRGYWRRRPTPGGVGEKRGGWLIAGAAAALWLWGHFVGFSDTPATSPPPLPAPTAIGTP